MLPWVIGGVTLAAVSYALGEREEKSIYNKRAILETIANQNKTNLHTKEQYNRKEKQSILFSQIKSEQHKLKSERRQLAQIRNTFSKGSKMHRHLVKQMNQLQLQIDQKQQDADRVRF
jgi:hypothetical protein